MSRPIGHLSAGVGRADPPRLAALAEDCPDGAAPLRALDALLAECVRAGASRLHVEIDAHGARARLRRDGRLDSRRLELGDAALAAGSLDAALTACLAFSGRAGGGAPPAGAGGRLGFECRVGSAGLTVRVGVDRVDAATGISAVFEPVPWTAGAPSLDELVDDAGALASLRAALASRAGLIVVVGTDAVALAAFADAIAQQCVGPERKVVRACEEVRHALAGVVQVEGGVDGGARVGAALRQDADVLVVDESPSAACLAALTGRHSRRALVVRTLVCDDAADALRALDAEGAEPMLLAHRLKAVVRLDRLRTLCEHCRRPLPTDARYALDHAWFAALTPLSRALAGSLQRFCEAPGCERCEGTGIERSAHALEVTPIDDAVRAALAAGAIAQASDALERARTLPARAWELARRGGVSPDEALRLETGSGDAPT